MVETTWLVTPIDISFSEQDVYVYPNVSGSGNFAPVISQVGGTPVYGGTPSDTSIKEVIKYAIDTKGLDVYFQPKLYMDIASGNSLTNPLDGTSGQPTYPWRGEITISAPALDQTAAARTEVEAFFGTDTTSDFTVAGGNVAYNGTEYSYRTFILHYALLCSEAIKTLTAKPKFKAFYVGGELASLTKIRDENGAYPAVEALTQLVTDVKAIFTAASQTVEVSYVAHWTEYHSHQVQGDPHWSNVSLLIQGDYPNLSTTFVDESDNAHTITNTDVVWSTSTAPSGFTSAMDFDGNDKLTIGDSETFEPGSGDFRIDVDVFIPDFNIATAPFGQRLVTKYNTSGNQRGWEFLVSTAGSLNWRYNVGAGDSGSTVVVGLGISLTESQWHRVSLIIESGFVRAEVDGITGDSFAMTGAVFNTTANLVIGATDNTASPLQGKITSVRITKGHARSDESFYIGPYPEEPKNIFFNMDTLWDTCDFVAIANFMPMSDWRDGENHADYGTTNDSYGNPRSRQIYSLDYLKGQIDGGEYWDYEYISSEDRDSQTRTALTDNFAYRIKDIVGWWENSHYNIVGGVTSGTASDWTAESRRIVFTEFGIPSIDKGTNEPDAFYKNGFLDGYLPHYSGAGSDVVIQNFGIKAALEYWDTNSPAGMIDVDEIFINHWDTRPSPYFPNNREVWLDATYDNISNNISTKIGAVFVSDIITKIFTESGIPSEYISISPSLNSTTTGYLLDAVASGRDSISPLEYTFHIETFESGGKINVKNVYDNDVINLTLDDLVVRGNSPSPISFERKLDSELPFRVNISYTDPGQDFTVASVSRSKAFRSSSLQEQKNLTISLTNSQAIALSETKLQQAWIERTGVTFSLPKNSIEIDPGDVVNITVNDIDYSLKVLGVNNSDNLDITCKTFSGDIFDTKYTDIVPSSSSASSNTSVFGTSFSLFMNLPLLSIQEDSPWAPRVGFYQNPYPQSILLFEDVGETNIPINQITSPSQFGIIEEDLITGSGVYDVVDEGTELIVTVANPSYQPTSVPENLARSTSNLIALRTDSQAWEIMSFINSELISANKYRLTGLVRGKYGTTHLVGAPVSKGAIVVFLNDSEIEPLSIEEYRKFDTITYRYGPSTALPGSSAYIVKEFTGWAVGLRPYPVTNIEFFPDGADMNVTWIRQTRASGLSFDAETIPLNEDQELYEIDVYNDTTLVETLTSTTPSVTITNYPANLRVEIYQMSLAVGRGRKAEKTYG